MRGPCGLWLAVGVWLAGCALGGQTPKYEYYVLSPTGGTGDEASRANPEQPGETATDSGHTLVVDRVRLPQYLERESLVTRVDDSELEYSRKDRWGERLDAGFRRTLRVALRERLQPQGLSVPSEATAGEPDCRLQVEVLRFEQHGADTVQLWARWILHDGREIFREDEVRLTERMRRPHTEAAVAALARAIGRFAGGIAEAAPGCAQQSE